MIETLSDRQFIDAEALRRGEIFPLALTRNSIFSAARRLCVESLNFDVN